MLKEPALISVCVPTYNYGRFIENCIRSVQAQTYQNWEMVITDDLSNDDTEAICNRLGRDDPRIRYIRNARRFGVYGNLAQAVDLATGSYIKILCSDDWLHPDCLARCLDLAAGSPSTALVCTNCIDTDGEYRPLWSNYILPKSHLSGREVLTKEALGYRCVGGNSSYFFPKRLYTEVGGYDGDLRYVGDYLLALKLCTLGDFVHTNEPLFYGRRHELQSSATDPKTFVDVSESFAAVERFRTFALKRAYGQIPVVRFLAGIAHIRLCAHLQLVAVYHYARGRSKRAAGIWTAMGVGTATRLAGALFLPLVVLQATTFRIAFLSRRRRLNVTVIHY